MKKKYIKRKIDNDLLIWTKDNDRKPLLLRGARQIGKSSSVRHLAENFEHFLEINFEKKENSVAKQIFERYSNPKQICDELAMAYNKRMEAGKTLLFFDEIQACPDAISALRFFYEEYPELHVIAAGSLLEFALAELPSFGVGRIETMFMFPMSFAEFMNAVGADLLYEAIQKANANTPLSDPLHNKAVEYLKKFLIIGGMPEVVAKYAETQSFVECAKILSNLTASLKSDFAKYKKRVPELQISTVFSMVTELAGKGFTYSGAGQDFSRYQIRQALELLKMAGLVIPVIHSTANGLPLGAEINPTKQKMLMIDTGILQHILGLPPSDILFQNDLSFVNKGSIAEIYAGLELLKSASCYTQQQLYFWRRDAKNSKAEVDFVIQKGDKIIPIEVKSGTTGKMQSLHLFMKEKQPEYGVRTSLENFAEYDKIKVVPLYAIGNILKI